MAFDRINNGLFCGSITDHFLSFDSRDRAQILYFQRNYSNALSGWELQDKNENLGSTEEKSYRTLAAALRLNMPGSGKLKPSC